MRPSGPQIGTAAITENLLKRKWSATILRHLQTGATDPAEIASREPDLSSSAMLERLRTMLRYYLIERLPRASPTAAVHYRLTLRGNKILKMLTLIEHLDDEPADFDESIAKYLGDDRPAMPVPPPPVALPIPERKTQGQSAAKKIPSPSTKRIPAHSK